MFRDHPTFIKRELENVLRTLMSYNNSVHFFRLTQVQFNNNKYYVQITPLS